MMDALKRTGLIVLGAVLALAPAATAQIPGMPLFTNPRYGSGLRIHADAGANVGDQKISFNSAQVYQGGVTLALGPVGIAGNVGMTKNDFEGVTQCQGNVATCDPETKVTASGLAQLRLVGGGQQNGALSIFGGISTDVSGYDTPEFQANCSGNGGLIPQATCDSLIAQVVTIPLGVSVGFKLGPIVLWGAPRYVLYRARNCGAAALALCADREGEFRYAVGADLPILGILAIRAAYDGGKFQGQDVNRIGLGASIGIGGVH